MFGPVMCLWYRSHVLAQVDADTGSEPLYALDARRGLGVAAYRPART